MISEIILGVIVIIFLAYHIIYVRDSNQRFHEINKQLMAKSLREYDDSTVVEHRLKEDNTDKLMADIPEYIPAIEADDKLWEKHIQSVQDEQ